jgi:hypothetical protein
MLYIKIDSEGNISGHPILEENLKYVFNISEFDDETLQRHGYARFERAPEPANAHVNHSTDYFMGEDGVVRNRAEIVMLTHDQLIDKFIRSRRGYLLAHSDWTQTVDSPLSAEKKQQWADYRQALRDLTYNYKDVDIQVDSDIVWPQQP